eukprot:2504292-Pyramimonas_sp.AAC.1
MLMKRTCSPKVERALIFGSLHTDARCSSSRPEGGAPFQHFGDGAGAAPSPGPLAAGRAPGPPVQQALDQHAEHPAT